MMSGDWTYQEKCSRSPGRKYHKHGCRVRIWTFHLQLKFDVICCVFDSMNHVASFTHWKQLFGNVHQHLSAGGVFIFDINTQKKLDRHIAEPSWVHKFGNNLLSWRLRLSAGVPQIGT